VRSAVPGAALLLVGDGGYRAHLEREVDRRGLRGDVVLTGRVPEGLLPAHYAAADVFAMPCRDRLGGLETEGLGICYLEAAAAGLPVVAGRSGGAPEAVEEGGSGVLVDGRDPVDVAAAVVGLLADRARSAALGARGRELVLERWSDVRQAERLVALLEG
jgi:phosphatidylinositol alpha-1,6-mannosyltransferase